MARSSQILFFLMSLAILAGVTCAAAIAPLPTPSLNVPPAASTVQPITATITANDPSFEKIVNLGVPVGNSTTPQHIALNSKAGQLYIFSGGVPILEQGNSIAVFDIERDEFIALARINQGSPQPLDLQFDASTGLLFALWDPGYSSSLPRTLSIVDAATLQLVREMPRIQTFAVADGLLYTADENTLAIWSGPTGNFEKQETADLPPANERGPLAVNLATNRVYVARSTHQTTALEIFTADTLTPLNTYLLQGPVLNILPNPSTGEVFVVEAVGDMRMLQRLSADGRPVAPPVELGPRWGDGITLSPDGETLYFTNGELRPFETEPATDSGPAFISLRSSDLSPQYNIPLLTNFDDIVIETKTNQAFAVYPYDNLLYAINLDTDATQTIYTAVNIRDILGDKDNGQLYVLDTGYRVRRLDGETFETLAESRLDEIYREGPIGQWAGELALDKNRNRLYVSGEPAFVLAADTLDLIKIVDPGGQFAPDPDGDKVYLSHCGVTVLDAATLTGNALLPGSGPRDDQFVPNPCVAHSRLDSANQLLYSLVPNGTPGSNGGNYLYLYDLAGPNLIFTDTNISITQALPDPAHSRAFVGHNRPSFRQLRTLAITPTAAVSYTHQLFGGGGPTDYNSATNRLYLSDNYRLLALDADSLNVIGEMPLPAGYDYQVLALNPAHDRVYLAGYDGQMLIAAGTGGASRDENLTTLQTAEIITSGVYTPAGKILQLESTANGELIARIDSGWDGPRLFLSTDEGTTWRDLNRDLPPFMARSLAVSPQYAEDNTLWAGLNLGGNTGGIYKSTDGGQSWAAAVTGLRDLGVSRLFISPNFDTNNQLVFADTTYAGLHVSLDGGQNWTPLVQSDANDISYSSGQGAVALNSDGVIVASQILGAMEGVFRTSLSPDQNLSGWRQVLDTHLGLLAFAPDDETVLGFGTTLWRSTDGGLTWEPGGAGLADLDRFEANHFLFSPNFATDRTVYLFFTDIGGTESSRLYRSTDGGQTWQPWPGLPENKPVTAVALATNGDFLLGDNQTQVTRIAADKLSWVEPELPASPFSIDDLAVSPNYAQDQTLFAVSRAHGLFKSADGGQSWQLTDFPVRSASFDDYRLAISPNFAQDNTLYVATGFSLHHSTDGGLTWQHLPHHGLNFPAEAVAISADNDTLLASTPTAILRSSNRGQSWQEVLSKPEDAGPVRLLAFSPVGNAIFVWFDYHDTLYTSVDQGQNWQAHPNPSGDYLAVAAGIAAPDESLIIATEFPAQLWQITNRGQWQLLTDKLPAGLSNVKTMAYTANGDLLIGGTGGVFSSRNNGRSWRSLNDGLPPEVEVQLIRMVNHSLFIILQNGNSFTLTAGNRWTDVSPNP